MLEERCGITEGLNMKKKLLSVLATTVLCVVTATSSFGASGVIRNGSVLVPLRGVFGIQIQKQHRFLMKTIL